MSDRLHLLRTTVDSVMGPESSPESFARLLDPERLREPTEAEVVVGQTAQEDKHLVPQAPSAAPRKGTLFLHWRENLDCCFGRSPLLVAGRRRS